MYSREIAQPRRQVYCTSGRLQSIYELLSSFGNDIFIFSKRFCAHATVPYSSPIGVRFAGEHE